MADVFDRQLRRDGSRELTRIGLLVAGRGACRHPDGAARFVETALDVFADDFARHARGRGCGRRYQSVLTVAGNPR